VSDFFQYLSDELSSRFLLSNPPDYIPLGTVVVNPIQINDEYQRKAVASSVIANSMEVFYQKEKKHLEEDEATLDFQYQKEKKHLEEDEATLDFQTSVMILWQVTRGLDVGMKRASEVTSVREIDDTLHPNTSSPLREAIYKGLSIILTTLQSTSTPTTARVLMKCIVYERLKVKLKAVISNTFYSSWTFGIYSGASSMKSLFCVTCSLEGDCR